MHTTASAADLARNTCASPVHHRLMREIVLGLAVFLLWMSFHGYVGVSHDSALYIFQALSHLHPERYAEDIFLRFGSQDDYTLFSPPYAAVIGWIGLDHAAALLTFLSHALFFACAWMLARAVLPARYVILALGLLVALPTDYGSRQTFHYLESFLTPRLASEALVLSGLAALIVRRHLICSLCLAVACLIHPLMAAPGIAAAMYLAIGTSKPRVFALLTLAGIAAMTVIGLLLPADSPLRMDDAWFVTVIDHAPNVFLQTWTWNDWSTTVVTLTALCAGYMAFREERTARNLCAAAIYVAALGLVTQLIGADWLRIALVTQAQPHRGLWIASVIAALLLPWIAEKYWKAGDAGRGALALIAALWLFREENYAIVVAFFALLAMGLALRRAETPHGGRLVLVGACIALAGGLLNTVANRLLGGGVVFDDSAAPDGVDRLFSAMRDGALPVAMLVALWLVVRRSHNRAVIVSLLIVFAGACAGLATIAVPRWTQSTYSPELVQSFESWRRHIPEGETVLWMEQPLWTWALLQRPSYFSVLQTASALFSRQASLELQSRQERLMPYLRHIGFSDALPVMEGRPTETVTLESVCRDTGVTFIVSRADLTATPIEAAPSGTSIAFRSFNLFQCPKDRD